MVKIVDLRLPLSFAICHVVIIWHAVSNSSMCRSPTEKLVAKFYVVLSFVEIATFIFPGQHTWRVITPCGGIPPVMINRLLSVGSRIEPAELYAGRISSGPRSNEILGFSGSVPVSIMKLYFSFRWCRAFSDCIPSRIVRWAA